MWILISVYLIGGGVKILGVNLGGGSKFKGKLGGGGQNWGGGGSKFKGKFGGGVKISGTLWEIHIAQLHSEATYYGDDNFSVLKEIVAYNCTSSATSIVFGSS